MTTPDTPSIDTPRMQLATVLEIVLHAGFILNWSTNLIALTHGITSPDRAIYEHPLKAV